MQKLRNASRTSQASLIPAKPSTQSIRLICPNVFWLVCISLRSVCPVAPSKLLLRHKTHLGSSPIRLHGQTLHEQWMWCTHRDIKVVRWGMRWTELLLSSFQFAPPADAVYLRSWRMSYIPPSAAGDFQLVCSPLLVVTLLASLESWGDLCEVFWNLLLETVSSKVIRSSRVQKVFSMTHILSLCLAYNIRYNRALVDDNQFVLK